MSNETFVYKFPVNYEPQRAVRHMVLSGEELQKISKVMSECNYVLQEYVEGRQGYTATIDKLSGLYCHYIFGTHLTAVFSEVYDAILCHVVMTRIARDSELGGAHPAFTSRLPSLIKNSRLLKRGDEDHPAGISADYWVEVDDEIRPVEIKADVFRKRDIGQLRRYMKIKNSSIGYAVAPKLSCTLPRDMVFVELKKPF